MSLKGTDTKVLSALATACAAALLALGGCGDSADPAQSVVVEDPKPTSSKTERAEYIAKVDKICKEYNQRVRELNNKVDRVTERKRTDGIREFVKTLTPFFSGLADLAEEQREAFKSVAQPKGDAAALAQIDELNRLTANHYRTLAENGKDGNAGVFRDIIKELKSIAAKRIELAQAYGFKHCGFGE